MQKITWKCACTICHRPIQRGNPTILFSIDEPEMVGICHATCGYRKSPYGQFHMCPPYYLSAEHISFLVQFYPRLYSLPSWKEPNHELRPCLARLLLDYPVSLRNPLVSYHEFLNEHEHQYHDQPYKGDLETDFIRILGQIQKAARQKPLGIEIDFRT